jgi:hypothetical protein
MTMIEQVARALCVAEGADPNWPRYMVEARQRARAAIVAMREPTEGMIYAAYEQGPPSAPGERAGVEREWRAMINAALGEP